MTTIDVHSKRKDVGQAQVLIRCADEFERRGVRLAFHVDTDPATDTDRPLICHQYYATDARLKGLAHRSVVVIERSDSADVLRRDYAEHESVRMIVKHGYLRHDLLAAAPRREHLDRIIGSRRSREPMSDAAVRKVTSDLTFGQYDRMLPWAAMRVTEDPCRGIDVMFAGSVNHEEPAVALHRQKCVNAMRSLHPSLVTEIHTGRPLHQNGYRDFAQQSKIMISPWGYGELCYRDYEAMFAGAVLIKPDTSHVITDPPMFVPGKTYIPCRPDWSDLADVIDDTLSRFAEYEQMRRANAVVMRGVWQADHVAESFVGRLHEWGVI